MGSGGSNGDVRPAMTAGSARTIATQRESGCAATGLLHEGPPARLVGSTTHFPITALYVQRGVDPPGCAQSWQDDTTCSFYGVRLEGKDKQGKEKQCCDSFPPSVEEYAKGLGAQGIASCESAHRGEEVQVHDFIGGTKSPPVTVICTDTMPDGSFKPKPIDPKQTSPKTDPCGDTKFSEDRDANRHYNKETKKWVGMTAEVIELSQNAWAQLPQGQARLNRKAVILHYTGKNMEDKLCKNTRQRVGHPSYEQCMSGGCAVPEEHAPRDPHWGDPGPTRDQWPSVYPKLNITGVCAAGEKLSPVDVLNINDAANEVPAAAKSRHFIAYETYIYVGGSIAWRAHNPGKLRSAPTEIAKVPGASGTFSVFTTMDDGRAAQRDLYLKVYGNQSVRRAASRLTPPDENDTATYLIKLEKEGVNLDAPVGSQIDALMTAIEANEGMIEGVLVVRRPETFVDPKDLR
jgi:hypothetical protein